MRMLKGDDAERWWGYEFNTKARLTRTLSGDNAHHLFAHKFGCRELTDPADT